MVGGGDIQCYSIQVTRAGVAVLSYPISLIMTLAFDLTLAFCANHRALLGRWPS